MRRVAAMVWFSLAMAVASARPLHAAEAPRQVAIIVGEGYQWEEVYGAFKEFVAAGVRVDLFSRDGGRPQPQKSSLLTPSENFMGSDSTNRVTIGVGRLLSKSKLLRRVTDATLFQMGFGIGRRIDPRRKDNTLAVQLEDRLQHTRPLAELDVDHYRSGGIYLPGGNGTYHHWVIGHGTPKARLDPALERVLRDAAKKQIVLGAVCHASGLLALVVDPNEPERPSMVHGRFAIGLPDPVERFINLLGLIDREWKMKTLLPIALLRSGGAKISSLRVGYAILNPRWVVRTSHRIYTGVGPKAAGPVAKRMNLGRPPPWRSR